ncbi:MAG: TetR/AcrR family transcriptional regulator [Gemmatimonadales bacterium]
MSESAATRARLLEAARELFTTTGYHASTTPMIATRAGVAEGTIYRHFASKQALLNAAWQEVQQWGIATVREVLALTDLNAGERLNRLGRRWLECAEHDAPRARMLVATRFAAELDEASRQRAAELHGALEQLIARGKQEGLVRPGVVQLWTAVWLALVAFAIERVASREWTATHSHAVATLGAAWDAIAR